MNKREETKRARGEGWEDEREEQKAKEEKEREEEMKEEEEEVMEEPQKDACTEKKNKQYTMK